MNPQFNQFEQDSMRKDPTNYKWMLFYYNPADSRIFVPKWNKWMGWTVNFANPYTYAVILGFIAVAVFISNLDRIF